jgi:hypothetical protein
MQHSAGETQEMSPGEEAAPGAETRRARRDLGEQLRDAGPLVAVLAGLLAIAGIAAGALIADSQTAATIAGSATAVVGSIVGAYLGVKIGTEQADTAMRGQREEAAKAQVYARHLTQQGVSQQNIDELKQVGAMADEAAREVRGAG